MESKKMALTNFFSGQHWRNRPVDMVGGEEGKCERYGE